MILDRMKTVGQCVEYVSSCSQDKIETSLMKKFNLKVKLCIEEEFLPHKLQFVS